MIPTMKTLLTFHMWIDSGAFSGSAYQTCTYHINRQGCLKEAQQITQNTIKGAKSTLIFFFMLECDDILQFLCTRLILLIPYLKKLA